jgi:hypothetical protein
MALNIILWSYLATYGFLLTRWAGTSTLSILFPLLLLMIIIFVVKSNSAFLLFALVIFSWIRSGICFQKPFSRVLPIELILTLGGAVLVAWFTPDSMFTRALGIWMFFLVQSLYFVFLDHGSLKENVTSDPFEEAMMQAEKNNIRGYIVPKLQILCYLWQNFFDCHQGTKALRTNNKIKSFVPSCLCAFVANIFRFSPSRRLTSRRPAYPAWDLT